MPPKLKTILVVDDVVDDDEGMRDTLGAILKKNYRVKLAVTGEEALAVLKREDVDLMLLDVRLPGINGLEVLKIVKEKYTLLDATVRAHAGRQRPSRADAPASSARPQTAVRPDP